MFMDYLSMDEFKLIRRYHPWEAFLDMVPTLLRRQVPPTEDAISVTKRLVERITSILPELATECEKHQRDWTFLIDELLESRKSYGDTLDTVLSVLDWYPCDDFWAHKVVSAQFFCDNYAKIKSAMEAHKRRLLTPGPKNSTFAIPMVEQTHVIGKQLPPGEYERLKALAKAKYPGLKFPED
jgi:hypothetical protein